MCQILFIFTFFFINLGFFLNFFSDFQVISRFWAHFMAIFSFFRKSDKLENCPKIRKNPKKKFKFENSYYFGPLVKIWGSFYGFCSFQSRFSDFLIFNFIHLYYFGFYSLFERAAFLVTLSIFDPGCPCNLFPAFRCFFEFFVLNFLISPLTTTIGIFDLSYFVVNNPYLM